MAFARYYIHRLPLANPPAEDDLVVTAPGKWSWARVRGVDTQKRDLKDIKFKAAGSDRLVLTVSVSGASKPLENSVYEILLGDAESNPKDEQLLKVGQSMSPGDGITFNNEKGYRMDRDPPPPPGSWQFADTIIID